MRLRAIACLLLSLLLAARHARCYKSVYNGNVAGRRSLSECTGGAIASRSDEDLTTTEKIRKEGYSVEEHVVLTNDGYLVTVHRIPGGPNAQPVLLQHGILTSSYEWVLLGKAKGLAFILADRGYDVWLGNARGNLYSQCHTKYATSSSEYWDFSFHDMGVSDLPAVITYISDLTGRRLFFIGHSMGTTMAFVMATERPDITLKIKILICLAPVVYRSHERSISIISDQLSPLMTSYIKTKGHFGIYSKNLYKSFVKNFCSDTSSQRKLCAELAYPVIGYDRQLFNDTYIPTIGYHYMAGTSLKTFNHFAQIRIADEFQQYDYGLEENLKRYNSVKPPVYNISRIEVPVALLWGGNDWYTHPLDVKRLSEQIPNLILKYKIKFKYFNHWDFMYVESAHKYVYTKVIAVMENYGKN